MAAGPRERSRTARTLSRNRCDNDEDNVHLDSSKDATENAVDILKHLCKKQGVSDIRRVALLNLFIRLMEDVRNAHLPLTLSKKEIFSCLRVSLVHSNVMVRAAAHKVIRHCITDPSDVLIINKLQVPYLIARSIDIILKNLHERVQAMRLCLRIMNVAPKHFPPPITRALVALVNGVVEIKDKMKNSALFLLCKLCVLNADSLIDCAGETCILRSCIEVAQGKINECLVGCLIFLLNCPETRNKANLRLDYLTSSYCDVQRLKGNNEAHFFMSSRLSTLAAIRTWPGVFHLCNPHNSSAMKAVISVLYLNEPELRKAIVDLFCEIFGLDGGDWSKDMEASINIVDPYQPRDSWRLTERFVAAEGKDILPLRADTRPNLTELHTALLVYSFLECGLLSALVEVAVKSDTFLSTQAIVLLGYLLHLSHKLVPCELLDSSASLPSLVDYATRGKPEERVKAAMTTSMLQVVHNVLSRPITPSSLFLRRNMLQGSLLVKKSSDGDSKLMDYVDSGAAVPRAMTVKNVDLHIKESAITIYRDAREWKWSEISTIVKCRNEVFLKLEDPQHRIVVKKLLHFYKPSSSQYSVCEFSFKDKRNIIYSTTALEFINLLLDIPNVSEGEGMLVELLNDISGELELVINSAHDSLLSPTKVTSTLSLHYFVMIGHLTSSMRGLAVLDRTTILQTLYSIVDTTTHEVIAKLIVSSLSYNVSTMARKILTRALTSTIDNVRVYTTEMLLVLARCQVPMFHTWGLNLLIPQIYDKNRLVANASMDILHELSYDPVIMNCLIEAKPNVSYLGDKGQLLLIRFLSTPPGFQLLNESNFIENELNKWEKGYNYRYVLLLEESLHDALTLHQREDNSKYSRRLTNAKHRWKPVWVPPHLYGQLAAHPAGMALLDNNSCIHRMIQDVHNGACETDKEIIELKSCLWGLANIGTSSLGVEFLDGRQVVQSIISIAQTCPVLSVRATAFYCLSLIATNEEGAALLGKMDWVTLRRCRSAKSTAEAELLERQTRRDDDGVMSANVAESDSLEDLTQFLEPPLTRRHFFSYTQRAHTLPPGLCRDDIDNIDEVDFSRSPPRKLETRHHRSRSETCSLLLGDFDTSAKRLSVEDAAGLATLQTLHATRRPDLSFNSIFPKELRRMAQHRHSTPTTDFTLTENNSTLSNSEQDTSFQDNICQPVYCGICLPRSLSQIFTITDRKTDSRRKRGSLSFSEMEQLKEEEKGDISSSSNSSDGENKSEGSHRVTSRSRHNGSQCISCCTKVTTKRQRKISTSSFRLRTDTESSYGNAPDGSPISLKWRLKATSEGGSGDSFSCGEVDAEVAAAPFVRPVVSVTRVRRDILKHVARMCNPVWAKASLQALLQLRQSHESVFQDACLYSDVCAYLSNTTCRVTARRFVQELFLDLPFSQFYDDADTILGAHGESFSDVAPTRIFATSGASRNEPPLSPLHKVPTLSSPNKNLSTVFENLSSCGAQSLERNEQSMKDRDPKT